MLFVFIILYIIRGNSVD